MKYLHFLKYNNYANRIMKVENSVSGYTTNGTSILTIADVKLWNPNDGVYTQITTPNDTDFSIEPDYLVASNNEYDIDSRWFIVESVRLHRGQYKCTLKRDVFAEAWNDLMQATCNIDRAILNKYSPLVFNPEPISVNQINKSETLIKDKTGCPWIVFYGDDANVSATTTMAQSYDISTLSKDDFITANSGNFLTSGNEGTQLVLHYDPDTLAPGQKYLRLLPYGIPEDGDTNVNTWEYNNGTIHYTSTATLYVANHFMSKYSLKSRSALSASLSYNGKVLYDSGASKYYRVSVSSEQHTVRNGTIVASDDLYSDVTYILTNYTDAVSTLHLEPKYIKALYDYTTVTVTCTEIVSSSSITVKVPTGSIRATDSPYFIWCMPYGNITCTVDGTTVVTDAETNLMSAMALSKAQSSSAVWDFQILPFCPLPNEYINADGSITVTSAQNISTDDTMLNGVNNAVGFVFGVPKSSFTRQILLTTEISPPDYKMSSLTEVYRLYSPNYASSFEFSVAKNAGLTGFNIRCTYMPINPYIRVTPIWGGLYGTNEDEVRGLVCGGDYSMARVNDAWVQYQEGNKNYQAIFNRQIDNMDVMRKYERTEQVVGSIVGALSGAGAGAFAGNSIGGATGSLVGAGIGTAGAIATGIADIAMSEGKYKESKSYATDMHELQLGNIQAMPRTIARTTAFNIDNRYFPILTMYRCTADEIKAVTEFIINRSMNVGIIGKPVDYIYNEWKSPYDASKKARGFMQGSIINIDTTFDTHFVDELNSEFQKGVYLR